MITLEHITYYALSASDLPPNLSEQAHELIQMCDLYGGGSDQIFLLDRAEQGRLLDLFQNKWQRYIPLGISDTKDTIEFRDKTDDEIRDWLHHLAIPYKTLVLAGNVITTWKMVIRHFNNLIRYGAQPLDGSWMLVFISESSGYAWFYSYQELSIKRHANNYDT